jgi:hypothetical protein
MADKGKTKITVERIISPFGEMKGKKMPEWFSLRQNILKDMAPVFVKRSMEVDPRKWKKKDIEDGVYAVARYELALFATQVANVQKPVMKELEAFKGKLPKSKKDETPKLTAALNKAEKEVIKLYKSIASKIEDKVSLALDEVESDKGDNKKALAAGKELIKRFDSLDTKRMFSGPASTVISGLKKLATDISKAQDEKAIDTAFKGALKTMKVAETDFEKVGRATGKVVKYMLDSGEKMMRDKKAAPGLQAWGKKIANGDTKKKLKALEDVIDEFGDDLDSLVHFTAAGKGEADEVSNEARLFGNLHKNDDKAADDAIKIVAKLSKEFKDLAKDLK